MNSLKLNNVRVLEFFIKEPDNDIVKNTFKLSDINVKYKVEFLVKPELKRFACVLQISYLYDIDNKNLNLLNSKIFFEFIAPNLTEENIFKRDFPEDFFEIIFSISYSTARGILISKTSDSLFNNIYLPITDPKEAIKNIIINPTSKNNKTKKK